MEISLMEDITFQSSRFTLAKRWERHSKIGPIARGRVARRPRGGRRKGLEWRRVEESGHEEGFGGDEEVGEALGDGHLVDPFVDVGGIGGWVRRIRMKTRWQMGVSSSGTM